jgi:hypothetical protein
MSDLKFFFYFMIGPLLMAAGGVAVYFLTQPRADKRDRSPAE